MKYRPLKETYASLPEERRKAIKLRAHHLQNMLQAILGGTTISCSGKDITIACDDHDTKDMVMNFISGREW